MIKNFLLASIISMGITTAVMAEEHEQEHEFYVVAKGLYTLGDKITEESATLEGKSGLGFGIDLGYTLGNNFALELDSSYSKNDIKEEDTTFSAKYMTNALDVVYAYPIVEELTVFGKLGYEFEHESANGKTLNENGMVYGVGAEYELIAHYEAVVEYEGSMIDSARGDSIYAGVKYIF